MCLNKYIQYTVINCEYSVNDHTGIFSIVSLKLISMLLKIVCSFEKNL